MRMTLRKHLVSGPKLSNTGTVFTAGIPVSTLLSRGRYSMMHDYGAFGVFWKLQYWRH